MFLPIALPALVGMTGLAVDVGQYYVAHSKLQAAVDAGALAGSLELPYDPDLSKGEVQSAAEEMVKANYDKARIVDVSPGALSRSVCVTAECQVDTLLMSALGITGKTAEASACAGYNRLEIVLVIDNTGSMRGTPINEVKAAARNLVDLILPEGMESDTKVGLVPFRGKVHVGAGVDGLPDGCRNADGSYNVGLLPEYEDLAYRYPRYYQLNVSQDTCSSIPRVQALTTDRDTIISAINSQTAQGNYSGTVISEGVKWGRNVLTEDAPYTEGGSSDQYRKIMILLTDGDSEDGGCGGQYGVWYTPNNYWTNAYYGMGVTDCHCEDGGCLDQAFISEVQKTKDADIEIFTIRYGNSDGNDVNLMKGAASSSPGTDDHYYDAPSAYDLDDIFKKIGKQLGWRLLS